MRALTMDRRIRVTVQAKTDDSKTLRHRSTTKLEPDEAQIYKALGISPQILKACKSIF